MIDFLPKIGSIKEKLIMKFYLDSESSVKRKALEIAMKNTGIEGQIICLISENPVDVRPLTRLDTQRSAEKRASLIAGTGIDENGYFVGIQKGTTVRDVTGPSFIEGHVVIKHKKVFHHSITRSIELPKMIRDMVLKGEDLYCAYEKVFGSEIQNKEWSIIEALTGKPEEKVLSKAIEGCLECFFGKANHYYLLG